MLLIKSSGWDHNLQPQLESLLDVPKIGNPPNVVAKLWSHYNDEQNSQLP